MLIEKIIGKSQDFDFSDLKVSKVVLDRYDMNKSHQKIVSENGETIAVSLERGETLFDGAVIYKDESKAIIVELAAEDILTIYPKGSKQWAKTAYNIGNMHQPAYIQGNCILIPYDVTMENIIKTIGVRYSRSVSKLAGERANVDAGYNSEHTHVYEHKHEQR